MSEEKGTRKVSFRYKISQNYAVYSIAGVHGGLNSQGDVIANLWSERAPIPRKQTYEVQQDGRLKEPPIEIESDDSIIRDVIFGLALEPETARAIGNWLIEKANERQKIVTKVAGKINA
ncbi:hypothetical protein DSCW_23270 [Desulfosarcina widdelii]|uniref:Uncharacterized protein n=1 Tax=Desulfosarcina widdelii TaxID=947919 RepID=A0A5K7Z2P4_9BACT|nr:hypothetical protein [Desulfosarcina widdelii]BBO74910.1 hypothetical protein DSCW_23270 [Desulfosarcina widdelii]